MHPAQPWQQPISSPSEPHRQRALERQGQLTKPAGSLGRLEALAVDLAALQHTDTPAADRISIAVFAGDHGVCAEGISAFPQAVTGQMIANFVAGGAAIRESTLTDPTVLESGFGEDYYAAIIEILSDAAPLSQGLGGEEMIQAVGTELSEAVAGTKTVEQALADAQAVVERIQR